ncbi:YciK family oxidoreductase [Dasania sp. GY-MA-18]|uniref:YciK family oxidoreductase n=1 Tax=Dasania phycosphaerae TaxID=2950436 RepID=A0A9J6RRJ7_9GAMM|nr:MULTISPECIES: YciK family oxidoreductase [Dasania]MCR8924252.1 YciK family oxidoreductase [Dasania sp. GY-MA-18]MCZ0866905.1 YciK family oxidoreductase [Dasania phycosphaerae]MCZ0870409.1 YciK family oxidoreductase [Dasania phycosphaerae]
MKSAQQYQAPAQLLNDRIILVTGAGDGIGRSAALAYASHGATVILLGKTVEKLEAVYDEIEQAGYPQAAIYPMDLKGAVMSDYEDMQQALAQNFGRLDGLLHNASVLGDRKPIAQSNVDIWQEVMQVNVNAEFMLTKAMLPLLESSASASIIFTSSGVGRQGRAYWGPYAVSKFATEGLMQVLADELANTSNIRVNAINPGATNTNMRRSAYPAEQPTNNPQPAALMPCYLYLMGDDSQAVNGLSIDAQ